MPGSVRTIDLRDAARMQEPASVQFMVKPEGSRCNLDCRYCYYLSLAGAEQSARMSEALLEKIIREAGQTDEIAEITFTWHGGEPLLAGLPFYRRAVRLQRRYASRKRIFNTIQTNGTLLNPEWASFFRDNAFLVGLSLDGPGDIHDSFRKDRGGHATFSRVMRGLDCLLQAGTPFNTLSAVSARSQGGGQETYRFLRDAGSRYLQFLPVSEPGNSPCNITGEGFGRFLCDVFDQWVKRDVGEIFVSQFDAALCCWCGLPPGTCVFARTCADTLTIDWNGDVYACDHFKDEAHRLGNLAEHSLSGMLSDPRRIHFVTAKSDLLPPACRACPWLPACQGECPQHRDGKGNRLCEGYKIFFAHTAPYFDRMRALLEAGKDAAEIMREIRN